jgi:DNA-binding MarR family transcriptional regulator
MSEPGKTPLVEETATEASLESFSDEELAALKEQLIMDITYSLRIPITPRQIEALIAVLFHPDGTVTEIARSIKQDIGNTHRRLRALIYKGLLRRTASGGYAVVDESLFGG